MERAGGGSKRHSAVAGKGGAKKILPAGWRFFFAAAREALAGHGTPPKRKREEHRFTA